MNKTLRVFLILAVLAWGLSLPQRLFAAQNDSVTIKVRVIDTTPPQGTIFINNGAQYTNQAQVTLNLSATDDSSGLDKMQFLNDNTTWSAPEDYATTKMWGLTTGDGTKTVYVKFKDVAGNWSSPASDSITLDTTPPQIGTINPSNGLTAPEIAQTFTCTYSDATGWEKIKEAYLLISTNTNSFSNSVYLYYDQNNNLLYLRNDTDTSWLGGYTPGSSFVIENSQIKLNCASTTVSGSTNMLTVNWNVSFKQAYSGKRYFTYLKAVDDSGNYTSWAQKGTYTVNNPPSIGTITPSSGTGQVEMPTIFTTTYQDLDSWQNIQCAYFLISTASPSPYSNCFYVYYNQNTNLLYLRDDGNTTWLGGYNPGSSYVIENSYAKLDCVATTISGSGTTLTVTWSVVLKAPFTGNKDTSLYLTDDTNAYTGWTKVGTWSIPNNPPSLGEVVPSEGTSQSNQLLNFTTTYSDPDGWQNIRCAYFLINVSTTYSNCFYAYYNQSANKVYLSEDAGNGLFKSCTPGSNTVLENSYVKLNCVTISGSGTTMTINWSIVFKPTFIGTKKMYLSVRDYANSCIGWTQKGTWTIQTSDSTPPTGAIQINNDNLYTNSTNVILLLSAIDDVSGMDEMQLSNDNIIWSTSESYSTTKTWDLEPGDGEKTVYVKFSDKAGNWSEAFSDTIILDTQGPSVLNIYANPVETYSTTTITGTVENTADLKEIMLTGPIDSSPVLIPKTEITNGNFTKQVTLTETGNMIAIAYDEAGNAGIQKSILITLLDSSTITYYYTYDDLNRLKKMTFDNTRTTYTYDEIGNTTNETTEGSAR